MTTHVFTIGNKGYSSVIEATRKLRTDYKRMMAHVNDACIQDGVMFRDMPIVVSKAFKDKYGPKTKTLLTTTLGEEVKLKQTRVKVSCIAKGIEYPSISDAAKALRMDDWTLNQRLDNAKGFMDECGNIWTRERPLLHREEKAC